MLNRLSLRGDAYTCLYYIPINQHLISRCQNTNEIEIMRLVFVTGLEIILYETLIDLFTCKFDQIITVW